MISKPGTPAHSSRLLQWKRGIAANECSVACCSLGVLLLCACSQEGDLPRAQNGNSQQATMIIVPGAAAVAIENEGQNCRGSEVGSAIGDGLVWVLRPSPMK